MIWCSLDGDKYEFEANFGFVFCGAVAEDLLSLHRRTNDGLTHYEIEYVFHHYSILAEQILLNN